MTNNFPKVYTGARANHDDWPFPFSLIPRKWTGIELMMPPRKVFGNAPVKYTEIQYGYPLAPDADVQRGGWGLKEGELLPYALGDKDIVLTIDPVHPAGYWSIQSAYFHFCHCRLPCYFSASIRFLGRVLHTNFGIKPDITVGDWYWWIEASLTLTKEPANVA